MFGLISSSTKRRTASRIATCSSDHSNMANLPTEPPTLPGRLRPRRSAAGGCRRCGPGARAAGRARGPRVLVREHAVLAEVDGHLVTQAARLLGQEAVGQDAVGLRAGLNSVCSR